MPPIEKICVEKVHHTDAEELANIKKMKGKDKFEHEKLKAAFYTKKLWPADSVIKIKFLEENPTITKTALSDMNTTNGPIDPLQQYFFDNPKISITDAVKKIVNERIQPLVSMTLKFVETNEDAEVRISFDSSGGAWALVGTDCQKEDKENPTMNLGWFDVSTVIHEFGHILGMIHEHQNPRGKSIDWNEKAVFKWAESTQGWDQQKTKENILDKYDINQINGSSFDPLSIMLYFFPADLTNDNKGTYQNLRLSGEDVKYITKQYKKEDVADKIFNNMYKENIETNIQKSKSSAAADETSSGNSKSSSTNYMIIGGVVLAIILIGVLIYFLYNKNGDLKKIKNKNKK
jgi:hypothetical protein